MMAYKMLCFRDLPSHGGRPDLPMLTGRNEDILLPTGMALISFPITLYCKLFANHVPFAW